MRPIGLRFLLFGIVLELFAIVLALSSSGLQGGTFLIGTIGLIMSFLGFIVPSANRTES
jgi:uncharacterized phage infection (PIP) family protein YhgE